MPQACIESCPAVIYLYSGVAKSIGGSGSHYKINSGIERLDAAIEQARIASTAISGLGDFEVLLRLLKETYDCPGVQISEGTGKKLIVRCPRRDY